MRVAHLFLPHHETHKRAYLLRWQALAVYLGLFILLQINLRHVSNINPQILGTTTSIKIEQVIFDTNKERVKAGLSELKENPELDAAAEAKAQNMFAENYWAHFSPSGKDPWGFIQAAGYKFSYAGENLARNFTTSDAVVNAWMHSPSHKENILNAHYQEIGIAVEDGTLTGERTTLVVQIFGTPEKSLTSIPVNLSGTNPSQNVAVNSSPVEIPASAAQVSNVSSENILSDISAISLYKFLGVFVAVGISGLLILEFITLKRRGVFQVKSHYAAHVSLLSLAAVSIITSPVGQISSSAVSIMIK